MLCTLYIAPKKSLATVAFVFMCVCIFAGFLSGCEGAPHPKGAALDQPPFLLSVVPGRSGITMAKSNPDEFYVVLTNVSGEPEPVWETWNSWGYQTISFELTTPDGKKSIVSKGPEEFTGNFPSTFLIRPGEHQVYAIRLDKWWETHPALPKRDEMPITLKAVYEVTPSP